MPRTHIGMACVACDKVHWKAAVPRPPTLWLPGTFHELPDSLVVERNDRLLDGGVCQDIAPSCLIEGKPKRQAAYIGRGDSDAHFGRFHASTQAKNVRVGTCVSEGSISLDTLPSLQAG